MKGCLVSQSSFLPGAAVKPEAYRDVVLDLRQRGEQYLAAASDLERLAGLSEVIDAVRTDLPAMRPTRLLEKRAQKLKARLTGSSGTSALVLAAMRGGADTLAAIAKDCKVKPSQARTALLALEDAGRVKRQGKSRATTYRLTNDK